jgi:recombination protein RecR
MSLSPLLQQLVHALRCLSGVGPKSAQRIALQLLERNRAGGRRLASLLNEAMDKIGHCALCRTLCEESLCGVCSNPARDKGLLCVIESVADIEVIERTGDYRGLYFVLHGHLSPISGIGPEEIGISLFRQRVAQENFREIILATNPTAEGETTAYYLAKCLEESQSANGGSGIRVTRIARGVPLGGELGYLDGGTIARALLSRTPMAASIEFE